jgi:hypothetical protein
MTKQLLATALAAVLMLAAAAPTAVATSTDPTTETPCAALCTVYEGGYETCVFEVSRDNYEGALGYYTFSGRDGDCGGTNPVLGVEKGKTYYFIQEGIENWYHPIGFAYAADGALLDNDELEPGIAGPGSTSSCEDNLTCPAPQYMLEGDLLGPFNINPNLIAVPLTVDVDDFGLDAYEPQFFFPYYAWADLESFAVSLYYPEDNDFDQDFFYFCHIHQGMTGRIKFVDADGKSLNAVNEPDIPYEYQSKDEYDMSCGTTGLDPFQLPNEQCPSTFVCNAPSEFTPVGKFANCIDTMNCKMLIGMTTNVNANSAIALFNHQMIPHHANAVNMCKALLKSGEVPCDDLLDEDDANCVLVVLCNEIINVQNAQIQTMQGILDAEGYDEKDDCTVIVDPPTPAPVSTAAPTRRTPKSKAAKRG